MLDLFTQVSGTLVNVYSATFQIFDKTSGSEVQVFPETPGDRAIVEVADDCPIGDRLSTGRYVARWTVPADENVGAHVIRWFIQLGPASPEQTYSEEFEVLAEVVGFGEWPLSNYCTVDDLRAEGYTSGQYSDQTLQMKIAMASRMIEASTRRFFFPKPMTIRVDGRGGPTILLNDPIISIEYVSDELSAYYSEYQRYEQREYRVYNRHITQNLTEPDDRNNPKIELVNAWYRGHRLVFTRGQQNVEIKGYFGYTDYDGSARGKTPDLIRHACKLLVRRMLAPLSANAPDPTRITSERTRDQSVNYAQLSPTQRGALLSGDPEIDTILAYFQRPPALGAA